MPAVTSRLFGSLAGLAMAMAVGIAAVSQTSPPVVKIDSGELQGAHADGAVSFKGIPFAAPPVGELRWRPPQPVATWRGTRDATAFAPSCPQQGGLFAPPGAGIVRLTRYVATAHRALLDGGHLRVVDYLLERNTSTRPTR